MSRKLIPLLLSALLTFAGCSFGSISSARRGRLAAQQDLSRGVLAIRTYGMFSPSDDVLTRLLKQKLGVELVAVAGCLVDNRIVAETRAYNEVMVAEITRKHGPNALERVRMEAEEQYVRELSPPPVSPTPPTGVPVPR